MEVIQQYIDQIVPVLIVIGMVLGAYLALLWLGLVVWTYWDIRLRSENLLAQLLAVLVVLLIPLGGVLLYMAFRPHEKLADVYARNQEREYIMQAFEERPVCPTCQRGVEPEFMLCPYCHTPLKKKCPTCARLMDLTWQVCPYCGQ
jgi:RNA polymerase subunit RPABC4/transcription elongation factor Spt4